MSTREATAILTSRGVVYAYPPVDGQAPLVPVQATIAVPSGNYHLSAVEAELLAKTIAPHLDPAPLLDAQLKQVKDKAAAAHTDLTETISSWTRELDASRQAQWPGEVVAESMENLLLALSETVVALRELKDGEL